MSTKIKRALLVEDNDDLRECLSDSLEREGYSVKTARDGVEGLALVAASTFDVIITDNAMPNMSGIEMIGAVRRALLNSSTPILIITGAANLGLLAESATLGIMNILIKPFNMDDLTNSAAQLIARRLAPKAVDSRVAASVATSTQDVLKLLLTESVTFDALESHRERLVTQGMATGLVTVMGPDHQGFLSLSLSQGFLRVLRERAFQSSEPRSESMDADMAGEVTNQVTGGVKSALAKHGIAVAIGLPQVVFGLGHKILHRTGANIYRFEFKLENCIGLVDFCIIEKISRAPAVAS